jgi:ABC-type glycerol-3-phosphate transport system substrate-binding protein
MYMKKGRQSIVLALVLLLLSMTMFTGCQKGSGKKGITYENEENMTFDQLIELDKQNPITINIMVADMKEPSASDSPVLKKIAEATGTTIHIQGIESDQLQMLMASQDYPDVLVIKRDSTFYDYLDTGDMIDLASLLQTYAPTVYQMNSKLIDLFKNKMGSSFT